MKKKTLYQKLFEVEYDKKEINKHFKWAFWNSLIYGIASIVCFVGGLVFHWGFLFASLFCLILSLGFVQQRIYYSLKYIILFGEEERRQKK